MATSKEYKNFILEQLSVLGDITVKPMMGEYLLYKSGVLFGGIYDNRLLVKIIESNKKYDMPVVSPYDGAKSMYFVDCLEDVERLTDIVSDTYKGLL